MSFPSILHGNVNSGNDNGIQIHPYEFSRYGIRNGPGTLVHVASLHYVLECVKVTVISTLRGGSQSSSS